MTKELNDAHTDFILRSLSKIAHKKWEHYAINRIYHQLNDPEIGFIFQQCIKINDKRYQLDLFLPQFGVYLEINESYHESDKVRFKDAKRDFDIVNAASLTNKKIPITGLSIEGFNKKIDEFVCFVRAEKEKLLSQNKFQKWDGKEQFTAAPHLRAGKIEIGPNAAFRTHKDALECFGYAKGRYQRATWTLPDNVRDAIGLEGKCAVWFPRFYENDDWKNTPSDDGKTIKEENINGRYRDKGKWDKRIVMARSRDHLNQVLYRFIGIFKPVENQVSPNEHIFERISTCVNTYSLERKTSD